MSNKSGQLKEAIEVLKEAKYMFQFQFGTIGSRSTTQKNKLILSELTFVKVVFLS